MLASNDVGVLASEQTLAKTPQKRLLTAFYKFGGILYHQTQINPLKRIIMSTKQFLEDLCDVINNNSEYMTIRKFRKKYEDFTFHYNENPDGSHSISIWDKDDKNEWHITVKQMYASK